MVINVYPVGVPGAKKLGQNSLDWGLAEASSMSSSHKEVLHLTLESLYSIGILTLSYNLPTVESTIKPSNDLFECLLKRLEGLVDLCGRHSERRDEPHSLIHRAVEEEEPFCRRGLRNRLCGARDPNRTHISLLSVPSHTY